MLQVFYLLLINCGAPQGPVLSSILFIFYDLYTNGIFGLNLNTIIISFADDGNFG